MHRVPFSAHDMVMTQTPNEPFPLRWNRESIAIIRCLAGVMVRDAYPTAALRARQKALRPEVCASVAAPARRGDVVYY